MTSSGRVRPLLSRLLLSLAIVTCVLGLSDAAMASGAPPAAHPASASTGDTTHSAHQHAAASAPTQAAPAPSDGHAGHGEGAGVHAVGCMVAVGVAAIAFLLVLGFFEMSRSAAAAQRLRTRVLAGLRPRPPSLTTLCVQRV